MERSPAHDVPFTLKEAARFWGVAEGTVRNWVTRCGLEPCGYRRGPGWPYEYRFGELAEVERRCRTSGMGRPRSKDRRSPGHI